MKQPSLINNHEDCDPRDTQAMSSAKSIQGLIITSGKTNGFIVGDFISDALYIFKEGSGKGEFSFLTEDPYITSKEEYLEESSKVLASFDSTELQKVVLSRIKKVDFDDSKSELLFNELVISYPNAFVYLISSKL